MSAHLLFTKGYYTAVAATFTGASNVVVKDLILILLLFWLSLLCLLLSPQDAFTSMTWVNLTANANGKVAGFVDWGWAIGSCSKSNCDGLNLSDQAIFATMYEHAGDWDTAWDPDVHFVRSDDWFKTIKQKVRGCSMYNGRTDAAACLCQHN